MPPSVISRRPRHPERTKLSDAVKEDVEKIKSRKGLINKRATILKGEGEGELEVGATMRPNDEQLSKINRFTRKKVSADEVVCFSTLSCNDMIDRDDDQFTKDCIRDFASMDEPYSPVGKSYLLDHQHSVKNAVGRIFDVGTKKASSVEFLTNDVYVPNTDQYKNFIEGIDFGINWAVSVGVMLGKDECSLEWCKAPFSFFGWWCRNGHDKGLFYTEDAEEDAWGFQVPCEPDAKGAQKCWRKFSEPRDFYELSQVFLGAQYFAQLDKEPDFKSLMKSVSKSVPVLGLSKEEADKLPLRHEPEKVSEARMRYSVKETEDGSLTWVDETKLIWIYDPSDPESGVQSLGKSINEREEEDAEGNLGRSSGEGESLESVEGDEDSGGQLQSESVEDAGTGDGEGQGGDSGTEGGEQPSGGESSEVTETSNENEEKGLSKKDVLSAAAKAKLSSELVGVVAKAEGDGLDALLLVLSDENKTLKEHNQTLSDKAEIGDCYVKELRSEAIHWYVKARVTSDSRKVSTSIFEKLLDRCGDDVELIKGMVEEQKELARAKFPNSVRRSSFPIDPNEKKEIQEFSSEEDQRIGKLHG